MNNYIIVQLLNYKLNNSAKNMINKYNKKRMFQLVKKLIINKNDLIHNLSVIKNKIGNETKIIAVVKANRNGTRFS